MLIQSVTDTECDNLLCSNMVTVNAWIAVNVR